MAEQLQLTFVNYRKDSYIVVEGKQNADRFFIIRQGKVLISKEVEVVEEEGGNVLGPGDFFEQHCEVSLKWQQQQQLEQPQRKST